MIRGHTHVNGGRPETARNKRPASPTHVARTGNGRLVPSNIQQFAVPHRAVGPAHSQRSAAMHGPAGSQNSSVQPPGSPRSSRCKRSFHNRCRNCAGGTSSRRSGSARATTARAHVPTTPWGPIGRRGLCTMLRTAIALLRTGSSPALTD